MSDIADDITITFRRQQEFTAQLVHENAQLRLALHRQDREIARLIRIIEILLEKEKQNEMDLVTPGDHRPGRMDHAS